MFGGENCLYFLVSNLKQGSEDLVCVSVGIRMNQLRSSTATACVLHTQMLSLCPVGWSLDMSGWRNTSGTTWTSTSARLALRTSGAHK